MNAACNSYVSRATCTEDVVRLFESAAATGLKVCLRGSGCSYGDAALSPESLTVDLRRMNRILDWDPSSGHVTVEPGVTVRDLWRHTIADGWWPPVVPGTMDVSMGGGLAMNYHGKNSFAVGPIGAHVLEFDLVTPRGDVVTCSRTHSERLFRSAIGGFGMLGCIVRAVLALKRVDTGYLHVTPAPATCLREMMAAFEAERESADYMVGWIDCFASGKSAGRGLAHFGRYVHRDSDLVTVTGLDVGSQDLPAKALGLIPNGILWRFMKPFAHPIGVRLTNTVKYASAIRHGRTGGYIQSLAAFSFLLDYVPNWKRIYSPGGLVQYQSFIPDPTAQPAFLEQLELWRRAGLVPWLGVLKRHRTDDFLVTQGVDGWSLALDIPWSVKTDARIREAAEACNRTVLAAGGRFYFAKDSTLDAESAQASLGGDALAELASIKMDVDPRLILQTSLSTRLFGDWRRLYVNRAGMS